MPLQNRRVRRDSAGKVRASGRSGKRTGMPPAGAAAREWPRLGKHRRRRQREAVDDDRVHLSQRPRQIVEIEAFADRAYLLQAPGELPGRGDVIAPPAEQRSERRGDPVRRKRRRLLRPDLAGQRPAFGNRPRRISGVHVADDLSDASGWALIHGPSLTQSRGHAPISGGSALNPPPERENSASSAGNHACGSRASTVLRSRSMCTRSAARNPREVSYAAVESPSRIRAARSWA